MPRWGKLVVEKHLPKWWPFHMVVRFDCGVCLRMELELM